MSDHLYVTRILSSKLLKIIINYALLKNKSVKNTN